MEIVNKKLDELIPYASNPRKNDDAVAAVANSIKEFGFKVPIVIDKNNVIIAGHTRLKAAEKLEIKKVPCIIAGDLTDKQVKALRLADNKVSEVATWDNALLDLELGNLRLDFDMTLFDFEIAEEEIESETESDEDDGYCGDAREMTADTYNLWEFDAFRADGKYQMPMLRKTDHIPERLIGFNYLLTSKDYDAGIHFYVDDYQFERIWRSPDQYIEKIADHDCALTPDFSLYMNMPVAMKIWNIYRSRLIGQMMQDRGIEVIPTLSWAGEETFEFCFDGIEPGGVVSISTVGVKKNNESMSIWEAGTDEAMRRLEPSHVVLYGGDVGYDFKDTKVVHIENEVTARWSKE